MEGQASIRPRRKVSATDLAYDALKSHGEAMHYKDLIQVILNSNEFDTQDVGRLMAQIHTEINLDSRFYHKGQGQWALREWTYKGGRVITVKTERPVSRPSRTARLLRDEDSDEEDGFGDEPEDTSDDLSQTNDAADEQTDDDWE